MFWFRSNRKDADVNAIPPLSDLAAPDPRDPGLHDDVPPETQQQRTARHLAMCRRLAELGMHLAEATAEQARAPGADDAAHKPRRKGPDPALSCARFCASVRQSVALEARIAAGPAKRRAARPYDARRTPLRRIFTEGTERHHDRNEARRVLIAAGEQALDADPQGERRIFDIVWQVCKDIGIKINKRTLHDEMLVLVEHWEGDVDNHPLLKPFPAWLIPLLPHGSGPPTP